MALRLGRHAYLPWLKSIVAWNPASVWTTYDRDLYKGIALSSGRKRWRQGSASLAEDPGFRKSYFDEAFGPPTRWYSGGYTQPNSEEWYRGGRGKYLDWACKWDYIAAARLEQQEVYNPIYRRWHWRLGTELLLFSFFNDGWEQGRDASCSRKPPVYESITVPTLLASSDDDDWDEGPLRHWENRWTNTNKLARLMRNTPGHTAFFLNTGHSIHNERPRLFSRVISHFFSVEQPEDPPLRIHAPFTPAHDEPCNLLLGRYPRIPAPLLDNPASARFLTRPANRGGGFSDGNSAGTYSLRLKKKLRTLAAARDPLVALAAAADFFRDGKTLWGNAAADLAVTGRAAYERFRALHPQEGDVARLMRQTAGEAELLSAARKALDRAYQVAWALRDTNVRERLRRRADLGWIAVSGEDDPPHRPVNTTSAPYPQYDLSVASHGQSFQIRYMVASPAEAR
jgi:hypothetical protein